MWATNFHWSCLKNILFHMNYAIENSFSLLIPWMISGFFFVGSIIARNFSLIYYQEWSILGNPTLYENRKNVHCEMYNGSLCKGLSLGTAFFLLPRRLQVSAVAALSRSSRAGKAPRLSVSSAHTFLGQSINCSQEHARSLSCACARASLYRKPFAQSRK